MADKIDAILTVINDHAEAIEEQREALIGAIEDRERGVESLLDTADRLARAASAVVDAWIRGDQPTAEQRRELEEWSDWYENERKGDQA